MFHIGNNVGKAQSRVSLAHGEHSKCWALLGQGTTSFLCPDFRTSQNPWKVSHALTMCH